MLRRSAAWAEASEARARGLVSLTKLLAQRLQFIEAGGDVAHDGSEAGDRTVRAAQRRDRELDRDLRTILAQRRHRERVAAAIAARAGLHHVLPAVPVPAAQPLWNDEVERLTDRLVRRKAEYADCAGVPEPD